MVDGNMACGTLGEGLMIRLAHEDAERALTEPRAAPMELAGRPMGGFLTVDAAGIAEALALVQWLDAAADHVSSLPPKTSRADQPRR